MKGWVTWPRSVARLLIGLQLLALGDAGLVLVDRSLRLARPRQQRLVLGRAQLEAVQDQREGHLRDGGNEPGQTLMHKP